jgi:hypothetical protein
MFDTDPFDRESYLDPKPETAEVDTADNVRTAVFRDVLGTKAGQQFAREVLALCGLHRLSFTGDAATTAFREGEHNVGLRLIADIGALAPSALPTILYEGGAK